MTRVDLHCPTCRWSTSWALRTDGAYGPCRCGRPLDVLRTRDMAAYAARFRRAPAPAEPEPPRYRDQDATWPQLIAAALEQIEVARTVAAVAKGVEQIEVARTVAAVAKGVEVL